MPPTTDAAPHAPAQHAPTAAATPSAEAAPTGPRGGKPRAKKERANVTRRQHVEFDYHEGGRDGITLGFLRSLMGQLRTTPDNAKVTFADDHVSIVG